MLLILVAHLGAWVGGSLWWAGVYETVGAMQGAAAAGLQSLGTQEFREVVVGRTSALYAPINPFKRGQAELLAALQPSSLATSAICMDPHL